MPNSLIEAMGLGVPSISTLCMPGETNDLIVNGENGLIVKKRDVTELQRAIDLLFEKGIVLLFSSISSNVSNNVNISMI